MDPSAHTYLSSTSPAHVLRYPLTMDINTFHIRRGVPSSSSSLPSPYSALSGVVVLINDIPVCPVLFWDVSACASGRRTWLPAWKNVFSRFNTFAAAREDQRLCCHFKQGILMRRSTSPNRRSSQVGTRRLPPLKYFRNPHAPLMLLW